MVSPALYLDAWIRLEHQSLYIVVRKLRLCNSVRFMEIIFVLLFLFLPPDFTYRKNLYCKKGTPL